MYMIDFAPYDTGLLVIADSAVAEQVVQPSSAYKYSLPKSDTMQSLVPLIGRESLILSEGEEWRALRKRFNRGFTPGHLHTLRPFVVDETKIYVQRLQEAAKTGEVIRMRDLAVDLSTDIVCQLTIGQKFDAQTTPEGHGHKGRFGLLTALHSLPELTGDMFILRLLNPVRMLKTYVYERIYSRQLYRMIKSYMQDKSADSRAITSLALEGMRPSHSLINNTVSQVKSFLFAGQDTTGTLIQWLCYELSHPSNADIHEKLVREHNSVFGPGPFSALEILESSKTASEEDVFVRLPYTNAFIRETLRLHPPAGTARILPPLSKSRGSFKVTVSAHPGADPVMIDGLRVYPCQWLIHRDPNIWGPDATKFLPDRWLDEDYMSKIPTGAFRAFERGPRSCIGQELAIMEAKVALCAMARGFEFVKIGLTGRNGEKEVRNVLATTAVPEDGMRMQIRLRSA